MEAADVAIVRRMDPLALERENAAHSEVDCTYSIITDREGKRYLQIDTYGSATRKMPNKKSQSLRFAPEAIQQLKAILTERF